MAILVKLITTELIDKITPLVASLCGRFNRHSQGTLLILIK